MTANARKLKAVASAIRRKVLSYCEALRQMNDHATYIDEVANVGSEQEILIYLDAIRENCPEYQDIAAAQDIN